MIDTVSLRHNIPLLPFAHMSECSFSTTCGHSPTRHPYTTWKLNLTRDGGTLPRLTWSSTPSGDWLTAEVSLPKFLFGNNVSLISQADVRNALTGISRFISETVGISFDAPAALVGRVDYCWNFPVGETKITTYVAAASHAAIPRMLRYQIGTTTVNFKQRSRQITIYGKHAEVSHRVRERTATDSELRDAVGQLRMEVSYRNSDGCKRLARRYGLLDRCAGSLFDGDIAHAELERTLGMLGLNKTTESVDARLDILREVYGDTSHFRCLTSFLSLLDRYGENFWQQGIGGYSRSSYYQYARELKQAGVWLKAVQRLPPLRLVRTDPVLMAAINQSRAA